MSEPQVKTNHIFVDESGDLTLFNKKGKPLLGKDGVSPVFMVGLAIINNPDKVRSALNELRQSLIHDPYFKGVPSFLTENNKTAIAFHAKDDLPEVRREVFRILKNIESQIIVAIRRKRDLICEAKMVYDKMGKKFPETDYYDKLVTCIFHGVLHKADHNQIVFSQRGNKERNTAFLNALKSARDNFEKRTHIISNSIIDIQTQSPKDDACLQAIDYYLWAIYRLFVNNEVRYFESLQDKYKLIMDLDDIRIKAHGEKYTQNNILTLQKIMPVIS